MAKNKIASYTLEQRRVVVDTLTNGRDFETVREQLAKAGVAEADLPSDRSLRTYQNSPEYQDSYRVRWQACDLHRQAAQVQDSVAPRLVLLQDRVLRTLEAWMVEEDIVPIAELKWFLDFSLRFQRLQVMQARVDHQTGRSPAVDAPARPFGLLEELPDAAAVQAAREAAQAVREAQAAAAAASVAGVADRQAVHAPSVPATVPSARPTLPATVPAILLPTVPALPDATEWLRKTADNAGFSEKNNWVAQTEALLAEAQRRAQARGMSLRALPATTGPELDAAIDALIDAEDADDAADGVDASGSAREDGHGFAALYPGASTPPRRPEAVPHPSQARAAG